MGGDPSLTERKAQKFKVLKYTIDFMFNYLSNILGGMLGQFGGEVELFGGGGSFPCRPPPSLDETLTGMYNICTHS